MKFVISDRFDPYQNIALERELMKSGEEVLFLWQNHPVVVFGRNQNPYAEIDLDYAGKNGIVLARRYSGGGAVYQDSGNLNYSWITAGDSRERLLDLIRDVFVSFGLQIEKSGRNDLLCDGRKFSGQAFFHEGEMTLYHGTLLIDVNLENLTKVLKPSGLKLKSKGISSVASRVVNLKERNEAISVHSVTERFKEIVLAEAEFPEWTEDVLRRAAELKKESWIFGESPQYEVTVEEKYSTGLYQFNVEIRDGIVKELNIYTDDLNPADLSALKQKYLNQVFDPDMFRQ